MTTTFKNYPLRVWAIRNLPSKAKYTKVSTIEEGKNLIKKMIEKDLKNKNITSNAFGLEVFYDFGQGQEWSEWETEEGEDIMNFIRNEDLK